MQVILWLEKALWSGPLLLGLMGSHLYFTLGLRGIQRRTLQGIRYSLCGDGGGVTSFGALTTALAAAIGTGNIIGVATAVALGGPGAVFWCWLTGVLGMATRYAETVLVLRHRRQRPDGTIAGGAMYVLEDRLHMPRTARCFAGLGVAAAVGTGALIQSNALATVLRPQISPVLTGLGTTILSATVILGGIRSISKCCEKLVPAMAGLYLLGCLAVLWVYRQYVPQALQVIVTGAFVPRAPVGGFVGSTILSAARSGTARGLFTNEAGMGTAPMAAAAVPSPDPAREALVSMTGVFWDTVVLCAMTGLMLVSAMLGAPEQFVHTDPGTMCTLAFSAIPFGAQLLTLCLMTFVFSTIVGWCWYGVCCWRYLFGNTLSWYRVLYLSAVFLGALGGLELVWSLGGVLAGLMAIPNLICLWRLRREAIGCLPE